MTGGMTSVVLVPVLVDVENPLYVAVKVLFLQGHEVYSESLGLFLPVLGVLSHACPGGLLYLARGPVVLRTVFVHAVLRGPELLEVVKALAS